MQTKYLLLIKNRNFLPIPWRKLWNFIYIALQGWRKLFDMGCAICFWGHKKSCKLGFLKILGSQVENFRLCYVSNSFSGWKDRDVHVKLKTWSFRAFIKLWLHLVCKLGCKTLINFTRKSMKFHNCLCANMHSCYSY